MKKTPGGKMTAKDHGKAAEAGSALTKADDWGEYYAGLDLARLERATKLPCRIDRWLNERTGRIFELGCGGSSLLARSAELGWEVSGIDFNKGALSSLRAFLKSKGYKHSNLIHSDIFRYDCSQLSGQYDILVSFGFLEHFKDPRPILEKWVSIVRPGGLVISIIPNLFSVNAAVFKRLDPEFWKMHVPFPPEALESFHSGLGLTPILSAHYFGKYNVHSLIPWEKIEERIRPRLAFKLLKYAANFGVGSALRLLPDHGLRPINPLIMGVYLKK